MNKQTGNSYEDIINTIQVKVMIDIEDLKKGILPIFRHTAQLIKVTLYCAEKLKKSCS
jgi:hypothetical protein